MATIRDRILAWQRTHIAGNSALTSNTAAFNAMNKAVADLLDEPWVNLVIQNDMNFDTAATSEKLTGTGGTDPKIT